MILVNNRSLKIPMLETLNAKISVVTIFDKEKNTARPYKFRWQGKDYKITKLGYYHKLREGRDLYHIFHVTDGNLDFRLKFNAENLSWILEEVSDGNPN